ncbi:MAG: hypothetical protein LC794_12350 [Acidobacteria bacterium]|nr:hypothetical protein [Acidobacteriota bacterium]MCA1627460.1 hypothetical protein [Acidobacteriota bacterium]
MRKVILYISVALIIFTLASQGTMITKKVTTDDYQEECLSEGCSDEEVRELWVSYKEECINEGCSREEVIELGGTPQGALAMLNHFRRLGFEVRDRDFLNLQCTAIGSQTKCAAVLMLCKDLWQCPDKVHESSWYVCGGCLGGSC